MQILKKKKQEIKKAVDNTVQKLAQSKGEFIKAGNSLKWDSSKTLKGTSHQLMGQLGFRRKLK